MDLPLELPITPMLAKASKELPPGEEGDWWFEPKWDGFRVLVLRDGERTALAFQQVTALPPSTWPADTVPQQLHLDLTVPTVADLAEQHERVQALGARLLLDRSDDPAEPLHVYADPAGHPFCLCVA